MFADFLGVVGQILSILGLYCAQYFVMKTPIPFFEVLKAGIVWIPAIIFSIGILACFIGFLPRLSVVIWGYVVFSFLISYFGPLMKFPKIVRKLAIFLYIPQLPVDSMNWESIIVISLFSIGLVLLGFLGYQRRDLILD
jgi:ABC-2 type transport system permease protein